VPGLRCPLQEPHKLPDGVDVGFHKFAFPEEVIRCDRLAIGIDYLQGLRAGGQVHRGVDDAAVAVRRGVENRQRCKLTVFSAGGSVDRDLEGVQRLFRELFADLIHLVKTADHVIVGGINRTAADGVVRMVAEEQLPGLVHHRTGVIDAAGGLRAGGRGEGVRAAGLQFRPGREWLHPAFEQVLRIVIALLDPHPGGKHRRQHVRLFGIAQFAPDGLEGDVLGGDFLRDRSQVSRQSGMDGFTVGLIVFIKVAQVFRQLGARLKVVTAAHHQSVRTGIIGLQPVGFGIERAERLVQVCGWPIGGIAVAVVKMRQQHTGAIRSDPVEQRGRAFRHAAPEAGGVHVETVKYLRQLRKVPEGVGDIADHHALSKELADVLPNQQIAHDRFRRNQEFIGKDIPGTDQDAFFLDILLQARQVCHADLQIILEDDRLPVQHKMQILRVLVQDGQEFVHEVNQLQAELLEGLIPFAVPVGVRNNMQRLHNFSSMLRF